MKKVLLGLLFCAAGTFAFGQRVMIPAEFPGGDIMEPVLEYPKHHNGNKLNKKEEVEGWYNWISASNDFLGTAFTRYTNTTIFPDSTVKQLYGSAGGGTELGYVGLHSIGQVFDPKSFVFDASTLSRYNSFRWDSVAVFIESYKRWNTPEMQNPDTLIIQFYTSRNNYVRTTTLTGGGGTFSEKSANVSWSPTTKLGANSVGMVRYILEDKDTTSVTTPIIVPTTTDGSGISVPANGLVAVTITFRPGNPQHYMLNDTIDHGWTTPVPTKKLNHLRASQYAEQNKEDHESYNHGLLLYKDIRYNKSTNGWNGQYYPGDGFISPNGNRHLLTSFYIKSTNVSVKDNAFEGYSAGNVYPNPTNGVAHVNFELAKSEQVNISVYNTLGQKVTTIADGKYPAGKSRVDFSVEDLKPGVYFYTMNAGGYTQTVKFTVAQ